MAEDKKPFPDPEVLPPEEDDDQEEDERPRRSAQELGPNPGMRRRRRRKRSDEKEDDTEITERALLIKLLGKGENSSKILEIFDKARHREGSRRTDFEGSQRAFIFTIGALFEKLATHNEQLMDRAFSSMDKFNELYMKLQEAGQPSKAKEIFEVGALVLGTELGSALQTEAINWIKERREKRQKRLQLENEALKKKLQQAKEEAERKKREAEGAPKEGS